MIEQSNSKPKTFSAASELGLDCLLRHVWPNIEEYYGKFDIMKTCLYNFDPHKPHFYIVELGFTGIYIVFFLFLLQNIDYGYSLEPPR